MRKNAGRIRRRYQRRGIMLNNKRRAADDVVGEQLRAIVTRCWDRSSVVEYGVAGVKLGRLRIGPAAMSQFRQLQHLGRGGAHYAQRNDLDLLILERMAIGLLM